MKYSVAVDVGGHNVRGLLGTSEGELVARLSAATDRQATDAETNLKIVQTTILRLLEEESLSISDLQSLAVGVPGPVDPKTGLLSIAPNIPHWIDLELGKWLHKRFPMPLALDNDVNMAALGEYWKGEAQGCANFFFMGIGTGIGGGVFLDGKLIHGKSFSAGEVGYFALAPGQQHRRIGDLGWFESVASGLAMDQQGTEAASANPESLLNSFGVPPSQVRSKHVFEAAALLDPVACQILDNAFELIAMAVVNITALLDPDAIIFGGGMSSQGERLLGPVKRKAEGYGLPIPPLRLSKLGEDAQLFGALYSALTCKKD